MDKSKGTPFPLPDKSKVRAAVNRAMESLGDLLSEDMTKPEAAEFYQGVKADIDIRLEALREEMGEDDQQRAARAVMGAKGKRLTYERLG